MLTKETPFEDYLQEQREKTQIEYELFGLARIFFADIAMVEQYSTSITDTYIIPQVKDWYGVSPKEVRWEISGVTRRVAESPYAIPVIVFNEDDWNYSDEGHARNVVINNDSNGSYRAPLIIPIVVMPENNRDEALVHELAHCVQNLDGLEYEETMDQVLLAELIAFFTGVSIGIDGTDKSISIMSNDVIASYFNHYEKKDVENHVSMAFFQLIKLQWGEGMDVHTISEKVSKFIMNLKKWAHKEKIDLGLLIKQMIQCENCIDLAKMLWIKDPSEEYLEFDMG